MKNICVKFFGIIVPAFLISGCASLNKTMREPFSRVDFTKNDFTLSEQVSGEVTATKVLEVDWYRLFHASKSAGVEGQEGFKITLVKIPIVGDILKDRTASYALYQMMNKNPGYDVIFYPQYETWTKRPILGLGLFYKKTTVKVTARLAKLNK